MYLSINDKVITRKQEDVYARNKKIIREYDDLPFYKKLFNAHLSEKVQANWDVFNRWMDERVRTQTEIYNSTT